MKKLLAINLEDNPTDSELIKEILSDSGIECELVRVDSEKSFILEIEKSCVDIILADYTLPGFDGLTALDIALKNCPDVPFIFVTGTLGEEIAVESLKKGATDYILKDKLMRLGPSVQRALTEAALKKEKRESLERLQKATNGIIQAMALTIETRDPFTAGHQRRVAALARDIAIEMDLPALNIEGIHMAGSIHDLGKLSVPADILSKPSKLTDIERQLIQTHPEAGYSILKDVDFPWPVAQIILQHHERINGSGYPSGLKGEELLIETRILSVADVVEAIASHRPYRPAMGIGKALEDIKENENILYDPAVVSACMRVFKEKGFEFDKPSKNN